MQRLDSTTRLILALRSELNVNNIPLSGYSSANNFKVHNARRTRDNQIVKSLNNIPDSKISDSFDFVKKNIKIPSLQYDINNGSLNKTRWQQLLKSADQQNYTANHNINQYKHRRPGRHTFKGMVLPNLGKARNVPTPIHIISFKSKYYPKNLLQATNKQGSHEFPPVLYAQGNLKALNQKSIAIVGSRSTHLKHSDNEPDVDGMLTQKYSEYFAKHGYAVIGGLAFGADTLAQTAANKVNGHTIEILPNGLDKGISPKSNSGYAEDTLTKGGALVSTVPLNFKEPHGIKEYRPNLISRDQWQTGMSNGVIAVKGSMKSGTKHAVHWAKYMHRPLGVPDAAKFRKAESYLDHKYHLWSNPRIQRRLHFGSKLDFQPPRDFALMQYAIKNYGAQPLSKGTMKSFLAKTNQNAKKLGQTTASYKKPHVTNRYMNKSQFTQPSATTGKHFYQSKSPSKSVSNADINKRFKDTTARLNPSKLHITDKYGHRSLNTTYLSQKVNEASKPYRSQAIHNAQEKDNGGLGK